VTPGHRAARDYLGRGWSVIPVRAGDKRPLIAWQPFQERLATLDELDGWFARWPDANVGVVTGAVSGLVVMDVDPRHGGNAGLAELEREHGALPDTVEALSGGLGRHLYFAHPRHRVHNRVGLVPGVDLRGDGGLIIAPPSLHPSGRHYEWRAHRAPDQIDLAPLPPWLLDKLGERPRHTPGYWRGLLSRGVVEGGRNDAVASLAGHLLWHGLDPEVTTELLLCWNRVRCQPPLSDAEVVRTVDSISRLHQHGTD
jgi:hypothetical protein